MKILSQTDNELIVDIPPLLLMWLLFTINPVLVLVGLFTLLTGDVLRGLLLIAIFGCLTYVGLHFLVQRITLKLDRPTGKIVLRRSNLLGNREWVLPLADLDAAEVRRDRFQRRMMNENVDLVFRHMSPAARVKLSAIGFHVDDAGKLADLINGFIAAGPDAKPQPDLPAIRP